jgi:Integrase zinc binding domain
MFFKLCMINIKAPDRLIKKIHYDTNIGHPGISETLRKIRRQGYQATKDGVTTIVKSCPICQM